jgi:Flp pilus assembly protein TadG
MSRALGRRTRGQSLVELALLLPLLLFFGLACIQFALIFRAYDDMVNVTRDAARWVSVHAQNTDTTTRAAIDTRLPSGITSARLTMTFSPACATLSSGLCTGRTTGTQISVASTYDITDVLFLPSTLGWGTWTIRIPTTLPTYTIFMQVEPS